MYFILGVTIIGLQAFLVQVQLKTEVPTMPSLTRLKFKLMNSSTLHTELPDYLLCIVIIAGRVISVEGIGPPDHGSTFHVTETPALTTRVMSAVTII